MAKRHNIDTIAEVLIDKLADMERTAKQIERATKTTLKIDTSDLKALFDEQQKKENVILSDLSELKKKNSTRTPNWIVFIFLLSFIALIGYSYVLNENQKDFNRLKKHNDYLIMKVSELEKELKLKK